ncbi:glycoside hydrolase family 76 protein [Pleomassaria siparia CBS 279.74]|uniref:mannan endo-1,6-alpha-mannosidase n=1 Tax=Pleomassaria siparia CBS 279.74 TaxID=1314801 RepID=A0A6G1K0E3_9PLEO|nr:glycoside hydrolase family 76 protein [Pleomassaria siparia CBS 279.74]
MRFLSSTGAVLLSIPAFASAIDFNPDDQASIKTVCSKYANGLMSMYKNNATGLAVEEIGVFPQPHYWWEAGAAWGGMVEYTSLTGDESYVKTLTQAFTANYGPANNIILPWRKTQQGNDDQAFWAFALMSALEYKFPEPENAPAKYIDVVVNAFENIVSRWDETTCGGGLKWQIYPENAYGYDYKNSISNGAVFALGARLARYTGEQKYADWAVKLYDWSVKVGLVSTDFAVFDGTDDKTNCAKVADETEWSYNIGVYLHGAAVMFDFTKGDEKWKTSTTGLLEHASVFFKPYDNATDIMYERACETGETGRHCNLDQQSFKAYLARFMAKTAIMAPFTKDTITNLLTKSAVGAAKACSGDNDACGSKWYTGGWDGTTGVGQQLSALEVTQALLLLNGGVAPAKASGDEKPSASSTAASSTAPVASSTAPSGVKSTATPSEAKSTTAPSEAKSTSAPKATGTGTGVAPAPSAPKATDKPQESKAPGASSTGSAVTTGKPAQFPENGPNCSTKITTIYVSLLSTSAPSIEPSAPAPVPETTVSVPEATAPAPIPKTTAPVTVPSGTAPATPKNTTTTSPMEFPGAGSSLKTTGLSVVGAFAVAAMFGLF